VSLSSGVEKKSDPSSRHANVAGFLRGTQAPATSKPTIGYAHSEDTKERWELGMGEK